MQTRNHVAIPCGPRQSKADVDGARANTILLDGILDACGTRACCGPQSLVLCRCRKQPGCCQAWPTSPSRCGRRLAHSSNSSKSLTGCGQQSSRPHPAKPPRNEISFALGVASPRYRLSSLIRAEKNLKTSPLLHLIRVADVDKHAAHEHSQFAV